ncbi:MAG: hypothetical protein HXY30_09550 [Pseudorhodoplanes sp.]|nr:hypothetical protein [Pseudorhodoplanes sp.]
MRLAAKLKPDASLLLYAGPPFLFGWLGTGVIVPVLWWAALALGALFSEHRPSPDYDELKYRPIAFAIALIAFVAIYYVARWVSPN